MTNEELNNLMRILDNSGYDIEVVTDAIAFLEKDNNMKITDWDAVEAGIEIVHLIEQWRKFDAPVETLKQIKHAFRLIDNVADHIYDSADDDAKETIQFIAQQEMKAIDYDLKEANKEGNK